MKKWYTILTALTLSIALAACSGESTDDTDANDDAAPVEAADAEGSEAAKVDTDATEAHGHSHGEEGHSHEDVAEPEAEAEGSDSAKATDATEAEDLGTLLATLDGSKDIEIACGTCIYGMEGDGCPIAATVGEESYFITGVDFETHGLGLCKAAAQGKVTGKVYEKGIVATKIELTD